MPSDHAMPRLLHPSETMLLVVDIQDKFASSIEEWDKLIDRTRILIQICEQLSLPIVVTEQYPKGLGHTVEPLAKCLPICAAVFEKKDFGCLQSPDLQAYLASLNRKQVMVCGIEAHICVSQSVHQLLAENYQVHLIQDAIAARHKKDYKAAIAKMQQSGAIPSCVEMALFELLGTVEHLAFKSLQALIR